MLLAHHNLISQSSPWCCHIVRCRSCCCCCCFCCRTMMYRLSPLTPTVAIWTQLFARPYVLSRHL